MVERYEEAEGTEPLCGRGLTTAPVGKAQLIVVGKRSLNSHMRDKISSPIS